MSSEPAPAPLKETAAINELFAKDLKENHPAKAIARLRSGLDDPEFSASSLANVIPDVYEKAPGPAYELMKVAVRHKDQVTAVAFAEQVAFVALCEPEFCIRDAGDFVNFAIQPTRRDEDGEPIEPVVPDSLREARVAAIFQYTYEQAGPEVCERVLHASVGYRGSAEQKARIEALYQGVVAAHE